MTSTPRLISRIDEHRRPRTTFELAVRRGARIRNYLLSLVIGVMVGAVLHVALAPAAAPRWHGYPLTTVQAKSVQIIREAWHPEGHTLTRQALRVAYCESRFNPRADNPTSTAWGLFQFLDGYHMSARRQAVRARDWYHRRKWQPWISSSSCWRSL